MIFADFPHGLALINLHWIWSLKHVDTLRLLFSLVAFRKLLLIVHKRTCFIYDRYQLRFAAFSFVHDRFLRNYSSSALLLLLSRCFRRLLGFFIVWILTLLIIRAGERARVGPKAPYIFESEVPIFETVEFIYSFLFLDFILLLAWISFWSGFYYFRCLFVHFDWFGEFIITFIQLGYLFIRKD